MQCDKYGQCPCHENRVGKTCNRFKKIGKTKCTQCYDDVNKKVEDYKKHFSQIKQVYSLICPKKFSLSI